MIRKDILRTMFSVCLLAAAGCSNAGNFTCSAINGDPALYWSLFASTTVKPEVNRQNSATPHFDFNPQCRQAYEELIRLRLTHAAALLDSEKRRDPDNLVPAFLENYADFFLLFFNEDPAEYEKRKPAFEQRLIRMKNGSSSDPYTLFTRSVLYFQWAAVEVKFGDHWAAAWSFRRAFVAGKENLQKFPGFAPSVMLQGALEVAAGTIPPGYHWLSGLLGIKGSVSGGMKRMESMMNQTTPEALLFHDEAVFYYCYLRFYILNDKEGVFGYIKSKGLDTKNNHLFAYLAANLSRNNHQADNAITIIRNRANATGYADLPVWDMELGYCLADHLDPEAAPVLERFLTRFKGKFYVKETLQKLSWLYWLAGDKVKANSARERLKRSGNQESEADKQAMKEAESGRWPQPVLLRARLLDDGGYYNESLALLNGLSVSYFRDPADQLELTYRQGRLLDALNRKDEAIAAYQKTVRQGEHSSAHYAARAALQTGYIYEQRADKKTAVIWFRRVLEMKNHEYKNSLDQKARAGLARCGADDDN